MPDGPESIGEVARLIRQMRIDIDKRFDTQDQRFEKLVSLEVYLGEQRHTDRRIDEMFRRVDEVRTELVEEIKEEERERRDGFTRLNNFGKGLLFVVLATFGTFVVTVITNVSA